MVTATNGTLTLRGASGREYSLSIYISDVVGAFVTFSTTGLAVAGSSNFYVIPENCTIKDISVTTGPTVMFVMRPQVNDVDVGAVISLANCINTLAYRAVPNISIAAGRKFTLVQA
jgi:hypothetical protein